MDSSSVAAPGGAERPARIRRTKANQGSKRHVVVERKGIPLALIHSAANVYYDSKVLEQTVDAVEEPIRKPRGRPRKRPRKRPKKKLHADKGYDFPRCRKAHLGREA